MLPKLIEASSVHSFLAISESPKKTSGVFILNWRLRVFRMSGIYVLTLALGMMRSMRADRRRPMKSRIAKRKRVLEEKRRKKRKAFGLPSKVPTSENWFFGIRGSGCFFQKNRCSAAFVAAVDNVGSGHALDDFSDLYDESSF